MCGLTGFVPKKNKQIDVTKLKMFAIANEERGTDSCGISIGYSYWKHGIDKLSKARDFLFTINKELKSLDLKNKPVIFHTRKSTRGSWTTQNAHPFKYNYGDGQQLTLAHNGSITNEWSLFNEYVKPHNEGVKYSDYIDSRVLAHGFASAFSHHEFTRILDMLKKYEGAAALLFYTNHHYYVWRGAASDTFERPMYYIETEEGWYFHSIPTVLALLTSFEEVQEVPNNTLLTFTQNGIVDSVVVPRVKPAVVKTTYSYDDYYKPTVVKTETFSPVKLNVLGKYIQNGRELNKYIDTVGNFCLGLATYSSSKETETSAKAVMSCTTKEEFEKAKERTRLIGISLKIPIINNKNKVIAYWDCVKNRYLEEGDTFNDPRTMKQYIYKNQTVAEYVVTGVNNKK